MYAPRDYVFKENKMNKEVDVKIKVIIETDFRYKYGNNYAPKFTIFVYNDPIYITHQWERHWESSSAKYLNYPTEPMMFTSYIPEKTIISYISDRGECRLLKYIGRDNFDYNYDRIKEELNIAVNGLHYRCRIAFNVDMVLEIYKAFVNEYLNMPIGGDVILYYSGTRIIDYIINKDRIEIKGVV